MSEVAIKQEIPEEWITVPLEECAEILDSRRIPLNSKQRSERIDGKSIDQLYPYYGATGQVGLIDDFIFEGNHLLIGEDGAPFFDKSKNVAYIANGKFWVNNHAHILNADTTVTSNKYLLHFLNSFNYKGFVNGTTRLKLNQGNLKKIPVPIAPPEQQKRVVAKIDELFSHIDAGIEALKKAKQLLKQYRQSVLKAAVTGELTKEWREENKDKLEPVSELLECILKERRQKWDEKQLELFKSKGKFPQDDTWKDKYKEPVAVEPLPFDIPDSWETISLDTLIFNIEAGKSFKCDERPPQDVETGIVKVSAVTWGEFNSEESKTITDKNKINTAYRIKKGDFLFSRANTIELIGACVIVKDVKKDLLLSDKIHRFNLPDEWKEWVRLCLRTRHGRNEIESLATGNQDSMRNISQGNVKSIRVPLLSIVELKVLISYFNEKIDSIQRLESEIEIQLIKANKNKQSILASAFSGVLNG